MVLNFKFSLFRNDNCIQQNFFRKKRLFIPLHKEHNLQNVKFWL